MKKSKPELGEQQLQNAPTVHTPWASLTLEQIRQRAQEIYLARGGAACRELDDLFQAERELNAGTSAMS